MGIVALGPAFESGLWADRPRGGVLRALCNNADDDRFECWPSYEFVAFTAGVGRSTAAREIKALIRLGLLEIVRAGGGRRRCNLYRVNVPLLDICRQRVRAAKIAAGSDTEARIEAMKKAREACEALLENRPAGGRFPEENRPADDQYRPAEMVNTVHGVDPNLQKNLKSEKTRAREAGSVENPTPGSSRCGAVEGADGSGPGGERLGGKEASADSAAEREEQILREARFVCDFITEGRYLDRTFHRWALPSGAGALRERDIEDRLFSLSRAGLAKGVSWANWARGLADGRAGVGAPPPAIAPPILRLMRAMRDGAAGETVGQKARAVDIERRSAFCRAALDAADRARAGPAPPDDDAPANDPQAA